MFRRLAIQWDRQGAYVWRVTDENTVERVTSPYSAREADRVHVDAELNAGDKVVIEGGSSLRDGQTVRTAELLKLSSCRRAEPRWTIH